MAEKKKTPEIRFEGFTEAWEQRKLGDIGEFKNGMNFNKDAMGHGYPFVNLQDIFGKSVVNDLELGLAESNQNQRQEYSLKKGDVLFIRSSVKPEGVGETALVPKDFESTTYSGFIIRFRPLIEMNDDFKRFIFSIKCVRKQIMTRATSSANTNINQESLAKISISIPLLNEQVKIGNFFKQLDNTIDLHQRKYEKTLNIKKAMLEKMFPKNGEDKPEIRFEGYTQAWEQRKLSDLADIIGGGTPSTSISEFWDGDIDWYSPVEIGKEVYAYESQRKITELGLKKSSAKILPSDKTVLFTSRAGIGDMAILHGPAATNQGFQSLVVKEENDVYFVYSYGDKIKRYALKNASGSTFLEISGKILGNMSIVVPSSEEQHKIGNFFKNLDDTIALYQRKLTKLQNIKKSCLEKMLV